jgi:cytochrome c-type biogenesis protein CcmH/NrfG
MKCRLWLLTSLTLLTLTLLAQEKPTVSLSPQQIFDSIAPSVFIVEALDSEGKVAGFGSGVAVGHDQIVTNKHVIDARVSIRVTRGEETWRATITHADPDHDLCKLKVQGLDAPPVKVRASSDLRVGDRVYAIGAPKGLELTFSEGIISSLREYGDVHVIQTTAAISQGSSGGGLFDGRGRLVGITTAMLLEGQSLNFAVPGEWVLALEKTPVSVAPGGELETGNQALAWAILGNEYTDRQEYERAIQAYGEAIRLKPDYVIAWVNLGQTYNDIEKFTDALTCLQEAVRLDRNDHNAWNNLAQTFNELDQSHDAMRAAKEALRLKPDFAHAWLGLGVAYSDLRQYEQALSSNQEAIRLEPDLPIAWQNLGSTYVMLGRYEEALSAYHEALRLKPDYPNVVFSMGLVYAQQNRRSRVVEVYERLKELDPELADEFFQEYVLP